MVLWFYQKEVPPGPFAIDDLQLSNGGADLEVIVKVLMVQRRTIGCLIHRCQICFLTGVSKYEFSAGRSHY